MIGTARERLAKAQAEVVRALTTQGPIPAGFDEQRLRTAARSLVNKRREALVRSWPALVEALGDGYVELFSRYAKTHPLPTCASSLADGRAFAAWLDAQQPISDSARLEALRFDLRYTVTPLGIRMRRGFAFKMAKLRETRTLVISVRLPWLGERWWRYPLLG